MGDYRDHPEFTALLAAVRASPADDLPRLVLADWLEEKGEAERAEFIRVQCELAKHPEPIYAKEQHDTSESPSHWCDYCRWQEKTYSLSRRERQIWEANKCLWWGEREAIHYLGHEREDADGQYPESPKTFASRGFIECVSGPFSALAGGECGRCNSRANAINPHPGCPDCVSGLVAGILPELVRSNPVAEVVLTDREPYASSEGEHWWIHAGPWSDNPNTIPGDIWRLMATGELGRLTADTFPTADAAKAALSAALLTWAASPSEVKA